MEKKTIGKFIAALRHANGYTQKQLADMLYVSDKTVSRWERDECSPDLSLIPAIAEIFNITADELLRGERKSSNSDSDNTQGTSAKQKKTEQQLARLIDKKLRSYHTLSFISVGITAIGLIIAATVDLAFSKGLIAFAIALSFAVISEICQLCFAVNAKISQDAFLDVPYKDKLDCYDHSVKKTLLRISLINSGTVVFCLPLVTLIDGASFGLSLPYWLLYGLIFLCDFYVVLHLFYVFLLQKCVFLRDFFAYDNTNMELFELKKQVLRQCLTVFLAVLAVMLMCIFVLNIAGESIFVDKIVFNDIDSFKSYVEQDYDAWYALAANDPNLKNDLNQLEINSKKCDVIYDDSGAIICEYYYCVQHYHEIEFSNSSGRVPIKVVRMEDFEEGMKVIQAIERIFYGVICIVFCTCAAYYISRCAKLSRRSKTRN